MIEFRNKKQIDEWVATLENHVTMLRANLICEERQCRIVHVSTEGFIHRKGAYQALENIKNSASMVKKYLDE